MHADNITTNRSKCITLGWDTKAAIRKLWLQIKCANSASKNLLKLHVNHRPIKVCTDFDFWISAFVKCSFDGFVQLINSSQWIWSITQIYSHIDNLVVCIFWHRNLDVVTQTSKEKTAFNNERINVYPLQISMWIHLLTLSISTHSHKHTHTHTKCGKVNSNLVFVILFSHLH